jgi:hypothetical protein
MCVDVDRYKFSRDIFDRWNGMVVLKFLKVFCFWRKFRPKLAEVPPWCFQQWPLNAALSEVFVP